MSLGLPILTLATIGLTAYCSYRGFTSPRFLDKYMFKPWNVLRSGQVYRLLSAGFLHANWPHLLLNMLSLVFFGMDVERYPDHGRLTFLLVYLGSIVGGNLVSLYLHRHHDYRALGASGGVCGILFAHIFLFPGGRILVFLFFPMPTWLYAILFVLLSFYGLRTGRLGRVGHDAHLGGAIIGLLITTLLHFQQILRSWLLFVVIVGLSLVLFFQLYRFPLYVPGGNPFSRSFWRGRRVEGRVRREAKQKQQDEETLNRLLDKISRRGMKSLTLWEKRQLKAISKRMREREPHRYH